MLDLFLAYHSFFCAQRWVKLTTCAVNNLGQGFWMTSLGCHTYQIGLHIIKDEKLPRKKGAWNFGVPRWTAKQVLYPDIYQIASYMGVSKNRGTPKSSILIGFSIINHPFWGTPMFWKHPYAYMEKIQVPWTLKKTSWDAHLEKDYTPKVLHGTWKWTLEEEIPMKKPIIFRFHVSFRGCKFPFYKSFSKCHFWVIC